MELQTSFTLSYPCLQHTEEDTHEKKIKIKGQGGGGVNSAFQYTTFYLRDHNTDGHLLLFFFEAVHLGHKRVRLFGTGPELGVFQQTTSYLREHITDGHLLLVLSKFVLLVTTE